MLLLCFGSAVNASPVTGWRIELQNRRLNRPGLPAALFHGRPFCSNALLYSFIKQRFMLQTCKPPWIRCSGFRCPSRLFPVLVPSKAPRSGCPRCLPETYSLFPSGLSTWQLILYAGQCLRSSCVSVMCDTLC